REHNQSYEKGSHQLKSIEAKTGAFDRDCATSCTPDSPYHSGELQHPQTGSVVDLDLPWIGAELSLIP
ncbi:hypothetical protein A2U01_0088852, partial [Trifolium medium]|nr:hypothetical protein [Trifolium medium]